MISDQEYIARMEVGHSRMEEKIERLEDAIAKLKAENKRLRKALDDLRFFGCHNSQVQNLLRARIDAALGGAE